MEDSVLLIRLGVALAEGKYSIIDQYMQQAYGRAGCSYEITNEFIKTFFYDDIKDRRYNVQDVTRKVLDTLSL